MKPKRNQTILVFAGPMMAACLAVSAQTNRVTPFRAARFHDLVAPLAVKPLTNAATGAARVEIRLPRDARNYRVAEMDPQTMRAVTNLSPVSSNVIRATIEPGRTLIFMENEAPKKELPLDRSEMKALFSTVMVKSVAASRPGEPSRTVSGTLVLLAPHEVPWDEKADKYIAQLRVMLDTDDLSAQNPLLPMTVAFFGNKSQPFSPEEVVLEKPNVDGMKKVTVDCGRYQTGVLITAYYQRTNTTRELVLSPLKAKDWTQMIISWPMLFAAVTGGLIGGVLRVFKQRGRRRLSHIARYIIEGAVVGLVIVTALLSGLLPEQMAGLNAQPRLVLAFSLAAIAGSVGAHFLDHTVNRLRGKTA